MTTTVMENGDSASSASPVRVVLTLGCKNAARWLISDNELLESHSGVETFRLDLAFGPEGILLGCVYPSKYPRDFCEVQADMSLNQIKRWVNTTGFEAIVYRMFRGYVGVLLSTNAPTRDPKVLFAMNPTVIISDELLKAGHVLHRILPGLMSGASYFHIGGDGCGQLPKPLADLRYVAESKPPRCDGCGDPMRPAGSSFVCEGCGSVKG